MTFHGKNQELIVNETIEGFEDISSKANGLHVTKKLLALCLEPKYMMKQAPIAVKIIENSLDLAQNPYGNYAIQIALKTFPYELSCGIMASFKGKMGQLSITKYASNVVERCLEIAKPGLQAELLNEFIQSESLSCNNQT